MSRPSTTLRDRPSAAHPGYPPSPPAGAPVQLSYHRCRRGRWARRALRWLHGNGALLLALLATALATGAAVWALLLLGGVL